MPALNLAPDKPLPEVQKAVDTAAYGALSEYKPSVQDRFATALMNLGLGRSTVEGLVGSSGAGRSGPGGMGLADFTPLGALFAVDETFRAKTDAERTAAMMGLVPGARPAGKAVKEGVEAAGRGIRAFHSSPHDFDRFDASKIGTGTGYAEEGVGFNFSVDRGEAEMYGNAATFDYNDPRVTIDGEPVKARYGFQMRDVEAGSEEDMQNQAAWWVKANRRLPEAGDVEELRRVGDPRLAAYIESKLGKFDAARPRMYEVNINANPDDFVPPEEGIGREAELARQGKAGIKSEGRYVVFPGNEHLIEIIRKYGVAGLLGGGAAMTIVNDGMTGGQAQAAPMVYRTGGGV